MKRAPEPGNSLPSKRQKLEDGYQSTGELFLPLDLVPLVPMDMIASYLDEQDLAAFDSTAKWTQLFTDTAQWWRSRLEQLKKIDPRIPTDKPADASSDWWRVQFKAHFARIQQSQWVEITYLGEKGTDFRKIRHPAKTLNKLIKWDLFLNKLNSDLIKQKIFAGQLVLDISEMFLTRFPSELIEDEALHDYWLGLLELYCSGNGIQTLPESIGNLRALVGLFCDNNKLQTLPESIGNLQALIALSCDNNKLQSLPESIVNLPLLEGMNCSWNQIQFLPEQLKTRFGEAWHDRTLACQGSLYQQFILPLYTRLRDGVRYCLGFKNDQENPESRNNHGREFKL